MRITGNGSVTYLEVPKLGERLLAAIQLTDEGFGLVVDAPVGPDVASLNESLATDLACKWPLTRMASLMSLWRMSIRCFGA